MTYLVPFGGAFLEMNIFCFVSLFFLRAFNSIDSHGTDFAANQCVWTTIGRIARW